LIKANPLRKPYLLYALQKLWKDTDIRIQTYKHSTIKQDIPDCFPPNIICTTKNVVNITMIWKKGKVKIILLDLFIIFRFFYYLYINNPIYKIYKISFNDSFTNVLTSNRFFFLSSIFGNIYGSTE
jgi:zona occludens toxin (predicted ATPase)